MDENKKEVTNPEVTEEVASSETTETAEDNGGESTEPKIDWKAEALKQKEIADNQKVRAERAEKLAKFGGKTTEVAKAPELSPFDAIALAKADIAEEDYDEVIDYAKYKGISVKDALKTNAIKATLAEKAEQRKTAMATNTGATRRSSAVVSEEALVSQAQSGKLPEGDGDIARLMAAKAKQGRK